MSAAQGQRHDVDKVRSRVGKIKGRMWVGSETEVGRLAAGYRWGWGQSVGRVQGGTSLLLTLSTSLSPLPRTARLFCDVYDPRSKSYCKRLQVLCPEHSKDPKVRLFFLYLIALHSSPSPYLTTFLSSSSA